ncbi:tumor necrosis factor ligand superfamily member 11-like [Denticeps clupeoides]|uniref:tumor necrosis factor ligand superfamily member 11-like n=1 Tax=Denticeps clupeoides TaxID=299321 RepID=UPI0010A4FA97|nr:tumor necrosis factor ligand superfamily member 11-like [Denticeps clupeoides]
MDREPQFRTLVLVLVVVVGLQLVCSAVLVLHLTGFLQADVSMLHHKTDERTHTGPVLSPKPEQTRCPKQKRGAVPVAHLPIKPLSGQTERDVRVTIVHWNADQGRLSKLGYHDGRILVRKSGLYFVYAKTCFRYYELDLASNQHPEPGAGHETSNSGPAALPDMGVQLIQYVFLERPNHRAPLRPIMMMKSGSTHRWTTGAYHMCCQQQGGAFALRTGDGVYVSVSNSWLLDPESEGSYFGAFRISS